MMELVNYGGEMLPRGYVYTLLMRVAEAQGHDKSQWRILADQWMQGHDLRQKLKGNG